MSENLEIAILERDHTVDFRDRLLKEYGVRYLSESDIPEIIGIGEQAFDYNASYMTEYDSSRTAGYVRAYLSRGVGLAVERDGLIAGLLFGYVIPVWYGNTSAAVALALWVLPEYRGKGITKALVTAFEEWGALCGAAHINIFDICVEGLYPSEEAFRKMGYRSVERMHVKEVG